MNNKEIDNYIKNNMSLFYSMTYKIKNNLPSFTEGHEFDDILQCVLEASVKYLRKYDIKKGSGIANYLNKTAYFQASRVLKSSFSLIRRPEYLICNAASFAKMSRLYNYSDDEIISLLRIPKCRLTNILAILKGTYEPLDETFLTSYKGYDNDIDKSIDINEFNKYIYNNTRRWSQRDKDIIKYLILKEGKETLKTLGVKYNVSRNCIYSRKKTLVSKLREIAINHRFNLVEELLNG